VNEMKWIIRPEQQRTIQDQLQIHFSFSFNSPHSRIMTLASHELMTYYRAIHDRKGEPLLLSSIQAWQVALT